MCTRVRVARRAHQRMTGTDHDHFRDKKVPEWASKTTRVPGATAAYKMASKAGNTGGVCTRMASGRSRNNSRKVSEHWTAYFSSRRSPRTRPRRKQ
jgi:hypothetical protein